MAGLLAAVGAAGCSLAKDEETGASPDEVVAAGDTSALLKSTLVLEGGCIAAKVGPKHLLVSARCVSGNAAFAAGKSVVFTSAASGSTKVAGPAVDAGTAPSDAGKDPGRDSGSSDGGSATRVDSGAAAGNANRGVTISEVKIHPSYFAKCKPPAAGQAESCGFNKLDSSDSPDIALILLENELTTVPSIPVDLDPVGQSDSLLVISGGCSALDGRAAALKTAKTMAVPAKSVNHAGSAYAASPQLVTRLASSYVVSPGAGWRNGDPRLCATDIGAPMFRGGSAAVAGITSNYTTYADGKQPVTTHHTRVDGMSRFKIGDWLSDLGVETMHSCSETASGCVKRGYDGGAPDAQDTDGPGSTKPGPTEPGDGGSADAIAPDAAAADGGAGGQTTPPEDTGPRQEQLPSENEDTYGGEGEEPDYSDAAAPRKKKKAAEGGCSSSGGTAPTGGLALGFALALGAAITRRRRAR